MDLESMYFLYNLQPEKKKDDIYEITRLHMM
jgi:hypothetical protein